MIGLSLIHICIEPIAIMSRIIYNIRDMKGGGIVDNGYTKRIRERVLSLEDGTVFVTSDFADIADTCLLYTSMMDPVLFEFRKNIPVANDMLIWGRPGYQTMMTGASDPVSLSLIHI